MNRNYQIIQRHLESLLPAVGELVLDFWRRSRGNPGFIKRKADKSLKTIGDDLSEKKIRTWIEERFPEDSIQGEEQKAKVGVSGYTWIIDPIDGTENYVQLGSKFSISVGLVKNNTPKVGVLCFPAEMISVGASEGNGAYMVGYEADSPFKRTVPYWEGTESLDQAFINGVDLERHAEYFASAKFNASREQQKKLRLHCSPIEGVAGSFTFTFLMFLEGHGMDAITHLGATPYDIAAICCIARELGYSFSCYNGDNIDFSDSVIPTVISRNYELHKAIIKQMTLI
jgi:myo-inositol-1(or 4)-monophosphatase